MITMPSRVLVEYYLLVLALMNNSAGMEDIALLLLKAVSLHWPPSLIKWDGRRAI